MEVEWALGASFLCGYAMACWHLPRRYRRIWAISRLRWWQNKWLQIEVARLRHAKVAASRGRSLVPPWQVRLQKPRLSWSSWHKVLLGLVHRRCPCVTRVLGVRPSALVKWSKDWQKMLWARLTRGGKTKKPRGRPPRYAHLYDVIRCIKETDPGYGHVRIANILNKD